MVRNNSNSIKKEFIKKFNEQDFNDEGMVEILGASFLADEPVIFGTVNDEYVKKEIEWYESTSLYVKDLHDAPTIWKNIASTEGKINSNYGWCIYSEENHSQYKRVLSKLRTSKNTRQATMIYTRPTMHDDAGKNGMKDFMCTNAVTYRIQDNKLHCTVQMRSNDVVFGYKNDYAWQKHVLNLLARDLKLKACDIYWQVASLHIYPRHFKFLK